MTFNNTSENIQALRAEMEASYQAARERAAARLTSSPELSAARPRRRVEQLLRESRQRVKRLVEDGKAGVTSEGPRIVLHDLHTLERLLSYVRHSVVRVCFYNLKLFCPSLVDAYDEEVREQVVTNIDQLGRARAEIEAFFTQTLEDTQTVAAHFPVCRRDALNRLDRLTSLATGGRGRLDEEPVRRDFAAEAPGLIDGVMEALQSIQAELDGHKVAVGDVAEQAVALTRSLAEKHGLSVSLDTQAAPKVFADESRLLDCFAEVITNAAKHAGTSELAITVSQTTDSGLWVEVVFQDNGRGMNEEELATCLTRGVSSGGTGEGLPMVVQVIEHDHLGRLDITAPPGKGCRVTVRLPVKLETARTDTRE